MEKHMYGSGIIGNCAYIAHVNKDTNVSWLCWPGFDSDFIFGGLLDKEQGGECSVLPLGDYTSVQYYMENTNVLVTEITYAEGAYRITDFAPRFRLYERYHRPLMLVRKIEPMSGHPRIKVTCNPVGDFGTKKLKALQGSNHIEFLGLEQPLRLTTNFSLTHIRNGQYPVLNETKYLVLTYGIPLEAPLELTVEDFYNRTVSYWREWIKTTGISNMYQEQVIRSSLALKLHQYEDTGAIIASCTTSLPESPGEGRNWDYRYCWLRDTFYILSAFNNIGHFEEAEHYAHFIANLVVKDANRYEPLYTIAGSPDLDEYELPLDGYMGNKPVRFGNKASEQVQNDSYGQVLLSLLPLYTDKRFTFAERHDSVFWLTSVIAKIETTIDEADAGIWEFRNTVQQHCYTNLFQWAGCKAAIKMAKHLGDEALENRAAKLMRRAAALIEACYDKERKVYTQAIGSDNLDASTLQLIMMNYLEHDSERARDHLAAVEQELKADNGLFYRYVHKDDFGKPKSTFLFTAFWYVEALACVGRLDEALIHFEELQQYANHLGLMSEDIDAATGSQWGNFPQAYSHVGLMNAAHRIAKKLDRPNFF
jgi:GH15 family glucan-1,4-alpha-glucosidase